MLMVFQGKKGKELLLLSERAGVTERDEHLGSARK